VATYDPSPVEHRILAAVAKDPDRTSVQAIADRAKCAPSTIYKSMQNSGFRQMFNDAIRGRLHAEVPGVVNALIHEAQSGDFSAAKLILEITGMYEKSQKISADMQVENEVLFTDGQERNKFLKDTLFANDDEEEEKESD